MILLIGLTEVDWRWVHSRAHDVRSPPFPTFLASTNPSTLGMAVYNQIQSPGGINRHEAIAHLADVAHVRTLSAGPAVPLNSKGAPRLSTVNLVVVGGSTDGYLTQQGSTGCARWDISPIRPTSIRSVITSRRRDESGACDFGSVGAQSVSTRPHKRLFPDSARPKSSLALPLTPTSWVSSRKAARSSRTTWTRRTASSLVSPALVKKAATIGPSRGRCPWSTKFNCATATHISRTH